MPVIHAPAADFGVAANAFEAHFDVLVVGGGHAGTEAAVAAARTGARVGLVTTSLETIGQMSCNPAVGGVAKGTVVREVDALGGLMGRASDLASVQFRMLHLGKGPAVWAPRSQCDRGLYRRAVRSLLEAHEGVVPIQGTVTRLLFADRSRRVIAGLETAEGRRFGARAVVLTTGTFGRGRLHIGTTASFAGGRAGDAAVTTLAEQLDVVGIEAQRFKTGTPPRIDGRSVATDRLEAQPSEVERFDWSWSVFWETPRREGDRTRHPPQLDCWHTHLGEEGQALIRDHLGESAMYGGALSAQGPRYCPSVEDKVVKFPDAARHLIFLEPEGADTHELYVNGLSTSLPAPVQLAVLRTLPGCEAVRMTRAGYAIEYDYYPPTQLGATLASRAVDGLWFAGQVNGTTGYEEAAAQGVVAGLNAGRWARDEEAVVLGRDSSFVGVLVDDLVARGVDEPYRLFTSRSEFRLTARQDNALARLSPVGEACGLYREGELAVVAGRRAADAEALRLARETVLSPSAVAPVLAAAQSAPISGPMPIAELVRRPELSLAALFEAAGVGAEVPASVRLTAELELTYGPYMARERRAAARAQALASVAIPAAFDFGAVPSLTHEGRQKLAARRPGTLAEASSIPGVRPSDVQALLLVLRRAGRAAAGESVAGA